MGLAARWMVHKRCCSVSKLAALPSSAICSGGRWTRPITRTVQASVSAAIEGGNHLPAARLSLYSHPFRPMLQGYSPIPCGRGLGVLLPAGKTADRELEEAWQPEVLPKPHPRKTGFAESSRDHSAELWAPPLAPTGTPALGDIIGSIIPLRQDALGPAIRCEHPYQPPEQSDALDTETSFGSRRKLIAGIAIVAALGMGARSSPGQGARSNVHRP